MCLFVSVQNVLRNALCPKKKHRAMLSVQTNSRASLQPGSWSGTAGLRILVFGLRIQGLEFRIKDLGFEVQGAGCRVQGVGSRVYGAGCRVQGAG